MLKARAACRTLLGLPLITSTTTATNDDRARLTLEALALAEFFFDAPAAWVHGTASAGNIDLTRP